MPQPTTERSPARMALWAIIPCVLWATAFSVVKIGLKQYRSPLTFAGWRFILAGCLLLPLCGSPLRALRTVLARWRLVLIVSMLQTVVLYGLFFCGMDLVPGASGAIIYGTSPLVAALTAHCLMGDDRMSRGKLGSIALGMAGVFILVFAAKPWKPQAWSELLGLGLLLLGSFCSAVANVVVARVRRPIPAVVLNSAQMGIGGAILTIVALCVEGVPTAMPSRTFFMTLVWLAIVSAVGFSMWFALLRHVKVSHLNTWKFLIPVVGAALSWTLLREESPSPPALAGLVCVATSIVLTQRQAARETNGTDASGTPPAEPPPAEPEAPLTGVP